MKVTKETIENFNNLNKLLSQGKMEDQPKTLEFIGGLVANHYYQDNAFAKAFRADPNAAVRALALSLGVVLSDKIKIVPVENDERNWHVPAPSATLLARLRLIRAHHNALPASNALH